MIPPLISVNENFPTGIMAGFDANGRLVICVYIVDAYTNDFLFGSRDDCEDAIEWSVYDEQTRREAIMMMWYSSNYTCCGNA